MKGSCLDLASACSRAQGKSARFLQFGVWSFLLFFGSALPCAKATTVWLDTDASIGSPFREVDDAFAILLALRCSNLRIAGISTTYGNASLRTTTAVTTDLLGRSGARIRKVHAGARSRKDLGIATAATEGLAKALRENRSLVYVALGPLTNLATFQILHPELTPRIHHVIFVGGQTENSSLSFGSRHPIQIHDANVFKDPAAVRCVLQAKIPMLLIPIEAAAKITVDAADLDEIGRNSAAGDFLRKNSGVWLWFWTNFVGTKGGPLFDAAAVVAAADPALLMLERRCAVMDLSGDLRVSKNPRPQSRRVLYCCRLPGLASQFVRQKLGIQVRTDHAPKNSMRGQP
jgi:purine nucleosidase/pyrimidine-specific ribonucleoside hydrolase